MVYTGLTAAAPPGAGCWRRPCRPWGARRNEKVSTILTSDYVLMQSEQAAVQALMNLLPFWYDEAGLPGLLRALEAALAECLAIRDEFADDGDPQRRAERGAISQHLTFLHTLCAG